MTGINQNQLLLGCPRGINPRAKQAALPSLCRCEKPEFTSGCELDLTYIKKGCNTVEFIKDGPEGSAWYCKDD